MVVERKSSKRWEPAKHRIHPASSPEIHATFPSGNFRNLYVSSNSCRGVSKNLRPPRLARSSTKHRFVQPGSVRGSTNLRGLMWPLFRRRWAIRHRCPISGDTDDEPSRIIRQRRYIPQPRVASLRANPRSQSKSRGIRQRRYTNRSLTVWSLSGLARKVAILG